MQDQSSRIGQTGQKIRVQTKDVLSQEVLPKKRPKPAKKMHMPKAEGNALLSMSERARLIEVTDMHDRPLLCMPPEAALRQGLCRRLALVAVRTRAGRLVLHKDRDPCLGYAGRWDVYADFVMVGEGREDAALRLLNRMGLSGILPRKLTAAKAEKDRPIHYALFSADLPVGLYPTALAENTDGVFAWTNEKNSAREPAAPELLEVDADELEGLVRREAELFTPEVLWAAGTGLLFR